MLWSAAVDPLVLRAVYARGGASEAVRSSWPWAAVADAHRLRAVVGGFHHGVRIDIAGGPRAPPLDRLVFPFTVSVAPRNLAEFRRLVALARGVPLAPQPNARRFDRFVVALRVIDALSEGASLRTVGEVLVRADDWPGRGEATKSAARRLVGFARWLWATGPVAILHGLYRG